MSIPSVRCTRRFPRSLKKEEIDRVHKNARRYVLAVNRVNRKYGEPEMSSEQIEKIIADVEKVTLRYLSLRS